MYKRIIHPMFFLFSFKKGHYTSVRLSEILFAIQGLNTLFHRYSKRFIPTFWFDKKGIQFSNRFVLVAGFFKKASFNKLFRHFGFIFEGPSSMRFINQHIA